MFSAGTNHQLHTNKLLAKLMSIILTKSKRFCPYTCQITTPTLCAEAYYYLFGFWTNSLKKKCWFFENKLYIFWSKVRVQENWTQCTVIIIWSSINFTCQLVWKRLSLSTLSKFCYTYLLFWYENLINIWSKNERNINSSRP